MAGLGWLVAAAGPAVEVDSADLVSVLVSICPNGNELAPQGSNQLTEFWFDPSWRYVCVWDL